jgi:hypothetical protein
MNMFRAVALAEGFEDGTYDELVEAWQYLLDTGIVWELQGDFGRRVKRLIEDGVVSATKIPIDNSPHSC